MHPSWSPLVVCLATSLLVAAPPRKDRQVTLQGLDLPGMDLSVAPGNAFYGYANGAWEKRTEIPADRAAYGVDAEVTDLTDKRTAALIKAAAAAKAPTGSELRKIGDCYTLSLIHISEPTRPY